MHTPGPWGWPNDSKEGCSSFDALKLRGPDGDAVIFAEIEGSANNATGAFLCFENPADARLIAAAPDLLEACEGALEYFATYHNCLCGQTSTGTIVCALCKLRAAIAKAEPGQE